MISMPGKAVLALVASFSLAMLPIGAPAAEPTRSDINRPTYPPSPVIEHVEFDFSTHKRFALGGDNWPTTWADDGHLYTAWGDGGGFGGSNSKGRVTIGVARVEGDAATYAGHNVWGGFAAEHPAQFEGKSYGILSVGGVLYMWVEHQPEPHLAACQLATSQDHGATWRLADWSFQYADGLTVPTFRLGRP
ncbi:MAG TPA: hypothetical protein VK961_14800 [Chthoniobacter sp.]|nr:hypothetical protein [Chthoniobacter sp.]